MALRDGAPAELGDGGSTGRVLDDPPQQPGRGVEVRVGPARVAGYGSHPLGIATMSYGTRKLFVSSMNSRFPEYAVPITGFPASIASARVYPNPSARCSDT